MADEHIAEPRRTRSDETDLREYLVLLWRYWFVLVVAALVMGGLAFARAVSKPRVYEASVPLALSSSLAGGGTASYGSIVNYQQLLQGEALAEKSISSSRVEGGPSSFGSVVEFEQLLENPAFAEKVIVRAGLDHEHYSASDFFGDVLSITEVSRSVLIVNAAMPDPKLAARVANAAAKVVVETVDRLGANAADRVRDALKSQLDHAGSRLEQARKDLRNPKTGTRVDLLQKQANVALAQKLYEEVATAYQTAQLQAATRGAELQIMQPAIPPDSPLSRHVAHHAEIWAGAGFLGAALLVILLGSLSEWMRGRSV